VSDVGGDGGNYAIAIWCQRAHSCGQNLAICVDQPREANMAKGEQRGNREAKKPKKQKIKVIAAAPSQKTAAWQPSFASGKKK
jgi:hypothetical protein